MENRTRYEADMLKRARLRLGYSQQEVATQIGVHIRQYQRFEGGERAVSKASMRMGLTIGDGTLADAMDRIDELDNLFTGDRERIRYVGSREDYRKTFSAMLQLVLYLCSDEPDMPEIEHPKKQKKALRGGKSARRAACMGCWRTDLPCHPELREKKHDILRQDVRGGDESQKILSQLRKRGSYTVIDMITVQLDIQKNKYFAQFSNLGLQKVPIEDEYPEKYDRLLCGGIWCIIQLDYGSITKSV